MRFRSVFSMMAATVWLLVAGDAWAAEGEDLDLLLEALAEVESRNDPKAVGDGGGALGIYQIHQAYWEDGTRVLGVDWEYAAATDPLKARQVVRAYLRHYGKGKSLLELARIHNGGPHGYVKKATLPYAQKVQAILSRPAPPAQGDPARVQP